MNVVARRLENRPLQVLVAGLVLAAGLAIVPAAAAQDAAIAPAQAAAGTAQAQLGFRIVVQDVIRVQDGDFAKAAAARAGWQPKVVLRHEVVDGQAVVTIAQP